MERTPEEEAEVQSMQDELLKTPLSAWSDEPPTENGVFWFRGAPSANPIVVTIFGSDLRINGLGSRYEFLKQISGGQWQPVQPPLA